MNKGLLILSIPVIGLGLTGCQRAHAPTGLSVHGVEVVMNDSDYQFFVNFEGEGEINKRVKWSIDVDNEIASIDEYSGILTTKEVKETKTINVKATSIADSKIFNTLEVTLYPSDHISAYDFMYYLRNSEDWIFAKYLKEEKTSITVECELGADDFITSFGGKATPLAGGIRQYDLNREDDTLRITGGFTGEFKGSRFGKTTKTWSLLQRENIGLRLTDFQILESENKGTYNCFQYDKDGDGDIDSIGFYTYLFKTSEYESEFRCYTFYEGLMSTIIEIDGDITKTNLHIQYEIG